MGLSVKYIVSGLTWQNMLVYKPKFDELSEEYKKKHDINSAVTSTVSRVNNHITFTIAGLSYDQSISLLDKVNEIIEAKSVGNDLINGEFSRPWVEDRKSVV
mgnify:CR=1 FL=1